MNIYTNLIINTKTGRGVSKSRKFHLQCISVPKKCLRHTMRHAIVSRFQIPMFTSERNAVRTALFARLVIGDTSYSLFFKGLLFRSVHCKTGKSFGTLLSQWASFLHEKQDVAQVLNFSYRVIVYRSEHPRLQLDWDVLRTYVVIIGCAGYLIRLTMSFDIR